MIPEENFNKCLISLKSWGWISFVDGLLFFTGVIIGGEKYVVIEEKLNGRKNNFDIIRLVASWLVVFSHSFPLLFGDESLEPLKKVTRGQLTFGSLAVAIFFILSGFLITMSFDRSKNYGVYFKARFLRIFPALLVVLVITVFLLGPITTSLSLREYFTKIATYLYIPRNLTLLLRQRGLPGVFENNIYPTEINGALWTLWYEVLFYVLVAFLGRLKRITKKDLTTLFLILMPINIVMQVMNDYIGFPNGLGLSFLYNHVYLFCYFLSGMIIYIYKDKLILNMKFAWISSIILVIFGMTGLLKCALPIFGTYLLFYVSLYTKQRLSNLTKMGDFSYGMYIYGFPIQQTITYFTHGKIRFLSNLIIVTVVTLIFAFLSWNIIEKKALRLK